MKVTLKRKGQQLGAIAVDDPLLKDAEDAAVASIFRNIAEQKQGDGAPLKHNAPSTLERKRRLGLGVRSLVASVRRFVQGGAWRRLGWDPKTYTLTIGPSTAEARTIVGYVVDKGYVGWLALDRTGRAAVRAAVRLWALREFRKWKETR